MLRWKMNRMITAMFLAFSVGLPAGMASAGIYYGVHLGYGHHYGAHYGYNYGHHHGDHDGGHEHAYDHEAYEHHDTPYHDSYYNNGPYTYGYSSYPREIRIYSHQQNTSIAHSGDGWALLRNNRPAAALNAFALEAREHPDKGIPKVGYALASAATGWLDRGVWAMRRALRFDPEALHYVAVDHILEQRIRDIMRRYEYHVTSAQAAGDTAFMQASLHYLLRESSLARHALGQTAYNREDTLSTKNLKQLIREK